MKRPQGGFFSRFTPEYGAPRDAIERHLEEMLNTKEGYGSILSSYGLGAYYAKTGTRDLVKTILEEIAEDVAQYEPRIHDASVRVIGRDPHLWLHFEVAGEVAGEARRWRVSLHTTYGNVRVKEQKEHSLPGDE